MDRVFTPFASRRSVVHSLNGIVACTQPLAAVAGQNILRQGGNAADAAVAIAACLNVTEPWSTGIGGDMFCLFYNGKTKKIQALNGSGRAPASITLEEVRRKLNLSETEEGSIPLTSVFAVTTPGAAAGWVDTVEKFGSGKLSLRQILDPAIVLAEKGFPASEISSHYWRANEGFLRKASPNFREMLKEDVAAEEGVRAPLPGEIMRIPTLANTFRRLASHGKKGFYDGPVAEATAQIMHELGGYLTLEDLQYHAAKGSQEGSPISLRFTTASHSVDVWEHAPNGQGIIALMTLGIIQQLQESGQIPPLTETTFPHNSAEYLHLLIESLRIAFADGTWWIADPDHSPTPDLLSSSYLASRANLFDPFHASPIIHHGNRSPALNSCDTVYFAVTDAAGNAISFINSTYHGFGSAIIPPNCGFTIQSRGANFSLTRGHPNVLAPRKRPYHTIIPAMTTHAQDGSLHSVFGVMGAFMQPQGHVQVLLNQLVFGMNPQVALDAPRICVGVGSSSSEATQVYIEEGIAQETIDGLVQRGHNITVLTGWDRDIFGRGQIIRRQGDVHSAGSDGRGDGMAVPVD
ncbi:hypothetical protein ASPZODRAFT_65373 [Penicilliopsis zonata CBS 506.65]|uniref:Gamma-glutamyltransferase n=1 Tax=Penicilliopsis zonata CBS 506.65 TaxID=1073090 RepID=A0A1L9SI72_9EURO|nr:hypothetical protein ASPZODRAFT_65373 [Penicilliopsis zonata CBS 506.65]OJJ46821.1 hypothetical protein ASPZODRAFT_65373 [Penicilliopsis zonata CBS 506.65]